MFTGSELSRSMIVAGSHVGASYPFHLMRYWRDLWRTLESKTSSVWYSSSPSTSMGGSGGIVCPGTGSWLTGSRRLTWKTGCSFIVAGSSSS